MMERGAILPKARIERQLARRTPCVDPFWKSDTVEATNRNGGRSYKSDSKRDELVQPARSPFSSNAAAASTTSHTVKQRKAPRIKLKQPNPAQVFSLPMRSLAYSWKQQTMRLPALSVPL